MMVVRISILAISLILLCFRASHITCSIVTKAILNPRLRSQINTLREKGNNYHTKNQLERAIKCYSAALQLVEGVPGVEAYDLRRRFGLNLGYCTLKIGSYGDAVARCSDVIAEASNFAFDIPNNQSKLLFVALSIAHRRRGEALQKLGKSELAEVDFAISKAYKSSSKTEVIPSFPKRYEKRMESLSEFVEECQSMYPRKLLSVTEIAALAEVHESRKPFGSVDTIPKFESTRSFGRLFRQFGPLLGISPSMIKNISSLLDAYDTAASITSKASRFIQKRRALFLALSSTIWLLSSLQ